MESSVRAVVVAIIVGSSSSSPPPPDPTWGEREGGALLDRGGFKWRLRARRGGGGQLLPSHPRPTAAADGSVLSPREFCAPGPHTAAGSVHRRVRKLRLEVASRLASYACTPLVRWGPWLYYRCVDEGKHYLVLCRRSAALHSEFVSYSDPSAGFNFTAGKRIKQKLVDYN